MAPPIDPETLREVSRNAIDRVWTDERVRREDVVGEVARLLAEHLEAERKRCADVCRERAALWRRTPLSRAELPAAREEARARGNEAAYLADLIETGSGKPAEGESEYEPAN